MNYAVLTPDTVRGILPKGGTILKTTNRDNPFHYRVERNGEVVFEEVESCVCIGENLYIWDSENEVYNRYILSWA